MHFLQNNHWLHKAIFACALVMLNSCSTLYHVQLGDIEQKPNSKLEGFEILVSATGFNMERVAGIAGNIAKDASNKQLSQNFQSLQLILTLSNMGPRTGHPTFYDNWADNISAILYQKCPSGDITGLMSVRENAKYDFISGEYVRIKGYCIVPETTSTNTQDGK